MKIKQYLLKLKQIKPQTHRIKILRGLLGAIPFVGSLLVEYSPEVPSTNLQLSQKDVNSLLTFINDSKNKKRTWFSSDREAYVMIDDQLCEQQGYVSIKSNDVYITFLHPFINNNYFFTLEPSNYTIAIVKKTNTYIHLHFSKYPKENNLRWFVKGAIK